MAEITELAEEMFVEDLGVSFDQAKAMVRLLKAERTRRLVENEGTATELRKARSALKLVFQTSAEERKALGRARVIYQR